MQVQVRVLGVAEVWDANGGRGQELSFKQRALLSALALYRLDGVRAEALIELLWPEQAPRTASGTLQGYVSTLRRVLEPGRAPRAPAQVLVTQDVSYRLELPDQCVDVAEFEAEVAAVHRIVTSMVASDGDPWVLDRLSESAVTALEARLTQALGLWRGRPYAELGDAADAVAERTRLDDLRLVAIEDRARLQLILGEQAVVVGELEPLVRAHPFRESLQAVYVLALAAAGRQGDALAALRRVRQRLADDLGADPGPGLRRVESAVLRQEPLILPRDRSARAAVGAAQTRQMPQELPLIGRAQQLQQLTGLLDLAEAGRPQLAVVVGEAGIGKTRLVREVCEIAAARGFAVAIGRCAEDDSAPPLWPWTTLIEELRRQSPGRVPTGSGGRGRSAAGDPPLTVTNSFPSVQDARAAQFLARDAMARELRALAECQPVVAVVEDFHWTDSSSAQLLRHVVETLPDGRLLLIVTRRPASTTADATAGANEALARRSAVRIDLSGLDDDAAAALLTAAAGGKPGVAQARALRRRTGGNPFFLVELARSGANEVPATVGDIIARRLAALPELSQELLRVASVVGEVFDLRLVASAAAVPEEQALTGLDAAIDAGLIRPEPDPDVFGFSHGLVRDAVYVSVAPSRRARWHAAVAGVLESADVLETAGVAGRSGWVRSQVAWHWLAAGPRWAPRAWPAAQTAAEAAVALHAYPEAAALLRAAADAAERDPNCSAGQRFDLRLAELQASTASGDRVAVQHAVARTVEQAWQLNDPRRAAIAAVASADGAIWALRPYGVIDHDIVRTLQRALRALPASDERLRCQLLLVLAAELYYADARRERQALVDEGLAMARRLQDPALLAWACLTAPHAIWVPGTAAVRHDLAHEAVTAARQSGSQTMLADALIRRAGAALELGRVTEIDDDFAQARRIADRLQLAYPLIAMNMTLIPWRAMQGRFPEAKQLSEQVLDLTATVRLQAGHAVEVGAVLPLLMWQGQTQQALDALPDGGGDAVDASLEVGRRLLLGQLGRLDELRVSWERTGNADPPDDWFTVFRWCEAAVTALALGLRSVGAAMYGKLTPFAGTVASAGASGPLGPVDIYLAVAAAAAGQPDTAAGHADDAAALCTQWGIPVCGQAVQAMRLSAGF